MDETVAMGSSEEKADLPYRDLQELEAMIPVFSLPEILGNTNGSC
jgi:hypothetical protein